MAFLPAILPYIATAGAVYTGAKQVQADKYNADVMANQQKVSIDQAAAQEALVRRSSRESLGRQAAAFGGAGVGYGGSSEIALDQSAINQELDALNTRYKGAIVGYGYGVESDLLKDKAREGTISTLLAGASAFKNFTYSPKSPSEMSGVTSPQPSSGLGGRGAT